MAVDSYLQRGSAHTHPLPGVMDIPHYTNPPVHPDTHLIQTELLMHMYSYCSVPANLIWRNTDNTVYSCVSRLYILYCMKLDF